LTRIYLLSGLMDLVDGHRFGSAVDEDQRFGTVSVVVSIARMVASALSGRA